mmetsp:Transcript_151154/g.483674  ORF Transcript_151154/g.483674 Transcript_151154/m.483674 type:complete len:282 (+) Transcript_151154:382-1227(+)
MPRKYLSCCSRVRAENCVKERRVSRSELNSRVSCTNEPNACNCTSGLQSKGAILNSSVDSAVAHAAFRASKHEAQFEVKAASALCSSCARARKASTWTLNRNGPPAFAPTSAPSALEEGRSLLRQCAAKSASSALLEAASRRLMDVAGARWCSGDAPHSSTASVPAVAAPLLGRISGGSSVVSPRMASNNCCSLPLSRLWRRAPSGPSFFSVRARGMCSTRLMPAAWPERARTTLTLAVVVGMPRSLPTPSTRRIRPSSFLLRARPAIGGASTWETTDSNR